MYKPYKETYLIPITFGITGHRDIVPQDMNRAEECIAKVIKSFRKRFPNSPLLFLSPLAQGADCLAAKTVLAADDNVYLQTIYPYDIEEYKKTIAPEWIESFNQLHNHEKTIGFHVVSTSSSDLTEEEKNQAYLQTGEFVATHSHILFALKNHKDSGKAGGTAEIIEYRKRGCVNLLEVDDSNIRCAEQGVLYEIRVRRLVDANEASPTASDDKYFITPTRGNEENQKEIMESLGILEPSHSKKLILKLKRLVGKKHDFIPLPGEIDFLNQMSQNLIENFKISVQKNLPVRNSKNEEIYQILESENKQGHETENIYTKHIKAVCDFIASDYQKKYRMCLYWIFAFSALTGLLHGFEGYFELVPFIENHPSIKYLFAGCAFMVWMFAKHKDYKHVYEKYRAISEALRVQYYWQKAGIQKSPANFFLSTQIDDNSWIRRAIRTAWLLDYPKFLQLKTSLNTIEISDLKEIEHIWIQDQTVFLSNKIKNFKRIIKRFNYLSNVLLGIGILFLLISNEFVYENLESIPFSADFFHSIGTASLIMLALVKTFVEMNAYEILIKRYEASFHIFVQCKKIYSQLVNLSSEEVKIGSINIRPRLQELFQTLGRSVLEETSEWYIVNSRIKLKNPAKK
jgi:hypothetical protein